MSDSPIVLLHISKSYSRAFEIIWKSEFEAKDRIRRDSLLLLRPGAQLLGVSIETSLKGWLSCRGDSPPRIHDLLELFENLKDAEIKSALDSAAVELAVPSELYDVNLETPPVEIDTVYRSHRFDFESLNKLYDRPYASRYPFLGGHSLPDFVALQAMVCVLQNTLSSEVLSWRR